MKKVEVLNLPELDYATSESMNALATNLSFCGENVQSVEITSRYASEGKSTVAFNLARTYASLGKRTVFVDTDLRRSQISDRYDLQFEEENPNGLAHYLSGKCEIQDVLYAVNAKNLYMVPVGRTVSASLQLLSSKRMNTLMEALRQIFDIIIVDTPPMGAIVDALEIAKHCDGSLIVVGYNQGRSRDLLELKDSLERSGSRVFGTVLNNVPNKALSGRKFYSGYGYYYRSYYNKYDVKKKK